MLRRRISAIAGVGAAAVALTFAVAGEADAYTVDPAKFVESTQLVNGRVMLTVQNNSSSDANCGASFHPTSELPDVQNYANTINEYWDGDATLAELQEATALLNQGITSNMDSLPLAAGETKSASWDSNRPDTSYAVLLLCTSNDAINGTLGAKGYLVEGSGASPAGPGTGSLGSLMP